MPDTEITARDLAKAGPDLEVIDVREPAEHLAGHIPGSRLIPLGALTDNVGDVLPDRSRRVVLYCATGTRSGVGAAWLSAMGYTNVSNLVGGFEAWKSEGYTWKHPEGLTADQAERYGRHLSLPGVGPEGQTRLLDSRVAVVGAGGLGSPVALYLAAAGVGTVGIVDHDFVDRSNLQRQVLHDLESVGSSKTESARQRILGLNPDVKVETHDEKIAAANVLEVLSGYDVIVDATDNFPTRYLINDASLHLETPVVHASIYRFEGQVAVFDPYRGPCYRCLYRLPPPPELAPSCEIGGVLGVLPGVIGTLQATEAIKLILGIGAPLREHLLIYDALEQDFDKLRIHRDPDCPACSDEANPPRIIDYDETCAPP
jgi:sulfur-carrier protein adenylyltransferase/sulfurtransferase